MLFPFDDQNMWLNNRRSRNFMNIHIILIKQSLQSHQSLCHWDPETASSQFQKYVQLII